uniref:FecR family protein n=1 Tax=uncultured Draconibacterium sp. TaxID=1573823 RepID=UPI003217C867
MKKRDHIPTNLIQQFLLGNLSISEEKELLNWIEESPHHKKVFRQEQQRLTEQTIESETDVISQQWILIKKQITNDTLRITPDRKHRFYTRTKFLAAAASLVIGIISYILIVNNFYKYEDIQQNIVQTSAGEKTNVFLPDGSIVYLNSATKLIYPENFSDRARELELIGEAFFKVSHNPEKPFIVHTNNIAVRVLGTEFNLRAFPKENTISTTLLKGKVRIEKEENNKIVSLGDINPSEKADYFIDTNKLNIKQETNLEQYIAWKDGKLVFENAPIGEVAKKLELWFNVQVIVKSEELKKAHFTMTFTNETIEQVLKLLELSYPIKYTINETGAESTLNADAPKLEITIRSNK